MSVCCSPRKDRCRIVLLGNEKVGKSALAKQFIDGVFIKNHTPTLLDIMTYQGFSHGQIYDLEIIDTSSDGAFELHRSPYIETADAIVLVYSVIDKESLLDLKKHVDEVVRVRHNALENFLAKLASSNDSKEALSEKVASPTSLYHKEVPIYFVGTHLDLTFPNNESTDNATSCGLARVHYDLVEQVSEHCLKYAGFSIGTTSTDEEFSSRKKKNNAFQRMFKNIFKVRKGADKSKAFNGVGKASLPPFLKYDNSNELGSLPLSPSLPPDESNVTSSTAVLQGVWDRLPIFELSVKNYQHVLQLFLLILELYIRVKNTHSVRLNTPIMSPLHARTFSSSSFQKRLGSPFCAPKCFPHDATVDRKRLSTEEKTHISNFSKNIDPTSKDSNLGSFRSNTENVDANVLVLPGPGEQDHTCEQENVLHETVKEKFVTTGSTALLRPISLHRSPRSSEERTEKASTNRQKSDHVCRLLSCDKLNTDLYLPPCSPTYTLGTCRQPGSDPVTITKLPSLNSQDNHERIDAHSMLPEMCFTESYKPSQWDQYTNSSSITKVGKIYMHPLNRNCEVRYRLESTCNGGLIAKQTTNATKYSELTEGRVGSSTRFCKMVYENNAHVISTVTTDIKRACNRQKFDESKFETDLSIHPHCSSPKDSCGQSVPTTNLRCANSMENTPRNTASRSDTFAIAMRPINPLRNLDPKSDCGCAFSQTIVQPYEHSYTSSINSGIDSGDLALGSLGPVRKGCIIGCAGFSEAGESSGEGPMLSKLPHRKGESFRGASSPQACGKHNAPRKKSSENVKAEVIKDKNSASDHHQMLNLRKDITNAINSSVNHNLLNMQALVGETAFSAKESAQSEEKLLLAKITEKSTKTNAAQNPDSCSTSAMRQSFAKTKKVNADPCSRNSCVII